MPCFVYYAALPPELASAALVSSPLTVIPAVDPTITGTKAFYAVGEWLRANCTLNGSIPSALLEWKINNYPVSKVCPKVARGHLYHRV